MAEALQNQEPERRDGDEECGQACGDVGFRPAEDDIGGDEEKDSDDGQAEQIAARNVDAVSAEGAEAEHEQAGGGEAKRAHEEWGEVLDGDADGQIGGAPEDVNQCKGDDDVRAVWESWRESWAGFTVSVSRGSRDGSEREERHL